MLSSIFDGEASKPADERRVRGSKEWGDLNALWISSSSDMKLRLLAVAVFTFPFVMLDVETIVADADPWTNTGFNRTWTSSCDEADDEDEYDDADATTVAPFDWIGAADVGDVLSFLNRINNFN